MTSRWRRLSSPRPEDRSGACLVTRATTPTVCATCSQQQRTIAVIPSTASRKVPIPHDARAYRQRNLVERMFCRLKDYRRVATRYDKLARNFLAGTLIAAALTWWLN